jgi:hypothetical protein
MVPRVQRKLAQYRYVLVEDLEKEPGLLDHYPHRYVFIAARPTLPIRTGKPGSGRLAQLFWCVETLETRGWESVAWDLKPGYRGVYWGVVMRRTNS